ncbi:hypothetical protein [uncultured virus]|uniref:Transcriptional coactivator p15 (PC4) C-terminal domain-containing protein n=1 Tax=uncultured virus TaxID=340016 RepID=A0A218MKE0_9VIRU|nr:hypothetical protein [uncultured virus]|tara:strand:- start:163 stop:453 length:291 start_codon:yes stop_codon:yes gene_type:complete
MDIDIGEAFAKPNGNIVKITLNEFRSKQYVHIREYAMDGDTGMIYPTKSGYAIPADEVNSIIPLLEEVAKIVNKPYVSTKQLEIDFGGINERKSVE